MRPSTLERLIDDAVVDVNGIPTGGATSALLVKRTAADYDAQWTLTPSVTSLTASSFLTVGTNPAASGVIRIPNNQWVYGRNNAGTADVALFKVGTDDSLLLGYGSGKGLAVYASVQTIRGLGWTNNVVLESVTNSGIVRSNQLVLNPVSNTVAISGGLTTDSYLAVGTNPAATGALRLANAQWIVARNAANTADGNLLIMDAANVTRVNGIGGVQLQFNGNSRLYTDTTGISITDAIPIAFGTTTGTKIGTANTQKLGFWNATPVVQPILATGAAHTVDDVITMLQTIGLCRQS